MRILKDLLFFGIKTLKDAKIENPRFEAEVLLANVLKKDRLFLLTHDDAVISERQEKLFEEFINRRANFEPVAYILGYKEFYGRKFFVRPGVLIPRPETESIIERVKADYDLNSEIKILDLCAGSGCIGLTLAKEFEKSKVVLSDISENAVSVTKKNAEFLELCERVEITKGDLFQNIKGEFDVIVSNPPYIAENEIKTLDDTVKNFEPHLALNGGEEGLYFYKNITETAKDYLKSNGRIYFEIGFNQGEAVSEILKENDFVNVEVYKDLAGLDRVVGGKRR